MHAFAQLQITIANYAGLINTAIAKSGLDSNLSGVYTAVFSAVGSNGDATFNGMNGTAPTGTGIAGIAGYNTSIGTLSGGINAGVVNGQISGAPGTTVVVTFTPYVNADGTIHIDITLVLQTGPYPITRKLDVKLPITPSLLLPPTNTTTTPTSTSGSSSTSSGATTSSTGGAPSADQLLYFDGPGGGIYDNSNSNGGGSSGGTVTYGPLIVLGYYE